MAETQDENLGSHGGQLNPGERILRWAKRISPYIGGNLALQALGFISGVLVIRIATKDDYALYSIYVGIIFSMTSLSDSGIGSTLLSHGSHWLNDKPRLAALFRTGVIFRRKLGYGVSLFGLMVLGFLYYKAGAHPDVTLLSAVFMLITLQAVFRRGIWQSFFRLTYAANRAQTILIYSASIRFVLIMGGMLVPGSVLIYLLAITAVTYWFESVVLEKMAAKEIDLSALPDPLDSKNLREATIRVLPMNLMTVVRGQLLIALITIFGSLTVIAETSALSRFAIAFAILNSVVLDVLSPRIARHHQGRRGIVKGFLVIMSTYLAISIAIVVGMAIFSSFILSLLGPAYSGLGREMIIILVGTVGVNFAIALGSLNQSRNWLHGSWTLIPLTLIWAVCGVIMFDLANTYQASLFIALQAVPYLLTELFRTWRGYQREGR
jgi:hypothetical protein